MAKITYTNKVALIPPTGDPANQWRDDDGNEVKAVVNENSEAVNDSTLPITFEKTGGTWVNSPNTPLTTEIILSTSNAINGGCAGVWYKAATLDISGGTVVIQSGSFVADELCLVWFIYDKGSNGFSVNIQSGFTGNLPSEIILFQDGFIGNTIDTNKWLITNDDPTIIIFSQDGTNNNIDVDNVGAVSSGYNAIATVDSWNPIDVVFSFDFTTSIPIAPQSGSEFTISSSQASVGQTDYFGISKLAGADGTNWGVKWRFNNGTLESDSFSGVDLSDYETFKIVDNGVTVKLYMWNGSWVEKYSVTGTFSSNMYLKFKCNHSSDNPLYRFKNTYVCSSDFSTQYPV